MSMLPVPVDNKGLDWPRKVANAIRQLQNIVAAREAFPLQMLNAAPADPGEGQSYYDLTLHKVRTWDGSAWQNSW